MKSFLFAIPTPIYFGDECVPKHADLIGSFGKRAYIITSRFVQGCPNYALEDIEQILKDKSIAYEVFMDVEENPPLQSVPVLTKKVKEFAPDFLIGIGGGSPLDMTKAVSVLLPRINEDPVDVFYGNGMPYDKTTSEGSLPVIAIPTTAGSSSEVTGFAVLTREDTQTKLAMCQKVFVNVAFLDARYIRHSPAYLLHTGTLDALAHGAETYVNINSNFMNRSIAEIGFKLFSEFKDNMLNDRLTDQDYEKMILASNIQGMAFMQAGTCLPHGMSYPLSHYKHMSHGLACGILLGEYLKAFKDQSIVQPIVTLCGFKDSDAFADYIKQIAKKDVKIQVTKEEINQWAREFCSLDFRLAKHPEPIGIKEITQIYEQALLDL